MAKPQEFPIKESLAELVSLRKSNQISDLKKESFGSLNYRAKNSKPEKSTVNI
ncbi:hypothetical protein L3X37_00630 [Sabulilitoribacter arenilitoris]|uniref:Uncharacterized protein n=1 Tax=Wocania arenilitoris TaxID=2044858 RepID=A0AAE3EKC4_9FLAO|nr:hypothetical protein [Wocania arenilitoris]MCF7566870.1 hypothetical protein [Wocania arenilitoris]